MKAAALLVCACLAFVALAYLWTLSSFWFVLGFTVIGMVVRRGVRYGRMA